MFSYYGRKGKVVKYYPVPVYDTIIEPFAGTAVYSLYGDNWQKKVILIDKYDVIFRIWKYLQQASVEDILKLPDVKNGEELVKVNGFNELLQEEKWLIGFSVNNGSAMPKNVAGRMNFNSWSRDKKRIAGDLHKIKHWDIRCDEYFNAPDMKATWFIDPPYSGLCGGKYYKINNKTINYERLTEWCKSRSGQTIVCGNTMETYLPFRLLSKSISQNNKLYSEGIYYNEDSG